MLRRTDPMVNVIEDKLKAAQLFFSHQEPVQPMEVS